MSHNSRSVPIIATIRTVFDVLVVVALNLWSFRSFQLPLPGVLVAIGVTLAALLVWALFLSVRPVLQVDRYLRALVALVFLTCGLAAAIALGMHWTVAALLFVAAATVSYFDVLAATKNNGL
ncbi:DUF2568 domain-containing protein [Leucobacter sp. OH2974_COT-288]|uniref:O-antigen ligase n=1 Tax=Canibacter oris TaxID=1365628 RepID=A0A840DGK5_9MICO|nr:DUF2568 domain-containing protein [Canibacter oris]MBB4070905.1 O-antigen ligase [Canibacter oris]RRD36571.1 DUF2568 domain-containing protein [Leucobacter sp. OH2974_COT-288]